LNVNHIAVSGPLAEEAVAVGYDVRGEHLRADFGPGPELARIGGLEFFTPAGPSGGSP
jgi:hypothetical protein